MNCGPGGGCESVEFKRVVGSWDYASQPHVILVSVSSPAVYFHHPSQAVVSQISFSIYRV